MLEQNYKFKNYDEDEDEDFDGGTIDPDREASTERG